MKKNYLVILLSLLFFTGYSQQLSQVTFSGGSGLSWFSLSTFQNILIRISPEGQIIEYGTEEPALYNRNYFAPKLRPYIGRVDYYSTESDSAFRGKIKSIGACFITYYPSSDYPEKIGKIKSAGSLHFEYYRSSDDVLIAGKIKNIGMDDIAYYTSFDNEALKGKLKLAGRTLITYYSSFEDRSIKGKLKSIGSYPYIWYNSFDRYPGGLKSGAQRQVINGVTYIVE
jgi:hypothetical protein